jgi:putative ABC transport system substrate-binding protein
MSDMRRRDFIALLGGAAVAWPFAARAQQAMPVVGFVNAGSSDAPLGAAFRKGLNEAGYFEGQSVTVEYHWLEGQFDRLPALMADLVRRRVAVLATPAGNYAAQVANAATTAIPIVFGVGEDPVKLGLVASLARPGGNLTGINFFANELAAKRLALLHELVPKAVRIAVLINPANPATESFLRDIPEAARAIGLQIQVLNASTKSEIEAAFATLVRDRADALYVYGDVFFTSRRVQFATLAASYRIPASYPSREAVEAGGLMGYTADRVDMYRQVGAYTGQILKGAKPADLPVLQSTKFEFVIQPANSQGARPRGAADAPRPRRRGDRMSGAMRTTRTSRAAENCNLHSPVDGIG